jgi:Peptidase M1 N-terminal domain
MPRMQKYLTLKVSFKNKDPSLASPIMGIYWHQYLLGALPVKASSITYNKESERVAFAFPEELLPRDAILTIQFTGAINNAMAGFHRSKYKPIAMPSADTPREGEFYYMLSTHFESCDARRAFPCFDEPNLKATFDFEIEVPKGQVALSNMPVKAERTGSKSELKVISFRRTPVMSTYVSKAAYRNSSLILELIIKWVSSFWLGQLAILNTSRLLHSANTMEPVFLSAFIPQKASRNRLALP